MDTRFWICIIVFTCILTSACHRRTIIQSNMQDVYSELENESLKSFLTKNQKLKSFMQLMVQLACDKELESYCNLTSTSPEDADWCINRYSKFLAENNYLCGLKLYKIGELEGIDRYFYFAHFYFESNPDLLFYCGFASKDGEIYVFEPLRPDEPLQ